MQAEARKRTSERSCANANNSSSDSKVLAPGRRIDGQFRLVRALDRNGRVWQASDERNRSLVLKTGPGALIEREYRLLSSLDHPHIVNAEACIDSTLGPFLVLEYLSGGDLVSLAGSSPKHWLVPISQVIDVLSFLHQHGIVHRDLKARNVLLDSSNRIRVIDFGSAEETGSPWTAGGVTAVTVDPYRGDAPVSPDDDVYALTCLLHEMLYGALPGTIRRKRATGLAKELAELVDSSLVAKAVTARPGLASYRAVVKSLARRRRDI